jgi:magnesium transporter
LIESVAQVFGVHRLAVEDIQHVHQRPKVEPYPEHLFVVMRMVHASADGTLDSEQVSLVLGTNFVLTFQEGMPGDSFGGVRERLRAPGSRLRGTGSDVLFHALVDSIVDGVFPAVEALGERIEALETSVLGRPTPATMNQIQQIKRALLLLRRIVFPAREATAALYRDPNPLIREETRIYLRDCHDHAVQGLDLVESYRELSAGLTELYLSSVSHRLNEVMKVLAVISTIFMPLSFIAGVYGMNFDPDASPFSMPELRWPWGYVMTLGLMAFVAIVLLVAFARRGWLGGPKSKEAEERS